MAPRSARGRWIEQVSFRYDVKRYGETLEGPSWEPKRCSGGARRSGSRNPETPRRPGGSCEAVGFHASRRSKE